MLLIGPTVKYNDLTFFDTHDNVSLNKYIKCQILRRLYTLADLNIIVSLCRIDHLSM